MKSNTSVRSSANLSSGIPGGMVLDRFFLTSMTAVWVISERTSSESKSVPADIPSLPRRAQMRS